MKNKNYILLGFFSAIVFFAAAPNGHTWNFLATATAAIWGSITGTLASQSDLQAQLDLKAPLASPTFTGTITTPLTASRACVTGASSQLASSATTATELGYVNGVTSAIQTQMNTKVGGSTGSVSGAVLTANGTGGATVQSVPRVTMTGTTTVTQSFLDDTGLLNGVSEIRGSQGTGAGVGFGAGMIRILSGPLLFGVDNTYDIGVNASSNDNFRARHSVAASTLCQGCTWDALPASSVGIQTAKHIKSKGTAPVATVDANAGTGATCTVTAGSTDTTGEVTLVTGSVATEVAGTECSIAFNTAYAVAPNCVMWPANSTAATSLVSFANYLTTTTAAMVVNAGATPVNGLTLKWKWQCMEPNS